MPAFAIAMLLVSLAGMAQQQDEVALPKLRITPECEPSATREDIVVCAARDKRSPYRLPKLEDGFDPAGPVDSVARERARLMQGDESGIGSCSNRGPGGMAGCWLEAVKNGRLQRGK